MEVQEMKDMIAAMKIEFEEAIDEKRQDFEATREELKVWVALKLIVFSCNFKSLNLTHVKIKCNLTS